MAKFTIRIRLSSEDETQKSEWLTFGPYYTDQRSESEFGKLSIIAFDAMLKTEQYWTDKIDDEALPENWPITARAFADLVETAGLCEFADKSTLDNTVAFIGLNTGSTLRDKLKDIAAAHGSNWHVTADEKLSLIPFENMQDGNIPIAGMAIAGIAVVNSSIDNVQVDHAYTYIGLDAKEFHKSPALSAIAAVSLENDEGFSVTAGSILQYTISGTCNYASSEGVAALALSKISGYVYKPFDLDCAALDPITELGDQVIVDGHSYQIVSIDWNISKYITANVQAPYDEEIDHEYKIVDKETKTYRKSLAATDEKLEGYPTTAEMSTAIQQSANQIQILAAATYVTQANYNAAIQSLQEQIEGTVTSYSGADVPTLNNFPAEDWTTDTVKRQHVGNVYLVTSGGAQAGQYYRFVENNGVFSWELITDSALAEALAAAAEAQEAAAQAIAEAEAARQTANTAKGTADEAVAEADAKAAEAYALAVAQAAVDATSKANAALAEAKAYADNKLADFLANDYAEQINALKQQIDKKAETYYQATDPYIEWGNAITGIAIAGNAIVGSDTRERSGDLWYKTSNSTTWRWTGTEWEQMDAPDEVFDKIDGKAQIFVTQPIPPYNVGDLWFNSSTSDIKTCTTARTTGIFYESDWEKRNKYTDDTKAAEVEADLNAYKETVTAEFTVQSNAIAAKVSRTGGETTSFGWQLTDTAHTWYAGSNEVMKVNSSGLSVTGEIKATSGFIGNGEYGFAISSSAISNGMTSFSDTQHNGVYVGVDGISLGGGKFKVTSFGTLTATGADISGYITATGGTIGGFNINSSSLSANGVSLSPSGLTLGSGFSVSSSGALVATGATISGTVTANNGLIGGFSISSSGLSGNGVSLSTSGITAGAGFSVSASGSVVASDLMLTGGSINFGNGTFSVSNSGAVIASNLTLTGGSLSIGGAFSVTSEGALTATGATISGNITATQGTIGGFTLSSTAIDNAAVHIGSDGLRIGSNFSVDANGNISATSGTFAGNVYARNIQVGATEGYITGDQVGLNTLDGSNLENYSLGDLQISGGGISTWGLSSGINTSLGYANFANGVFNNTETANYIRAGSILAGTIQAANTIEIAEIPVATTQHYHQFTERDGVIYISQATQQQGSFNIADTNAYKDGVSAAKTEAAKTARLSQLGVTATGSPYDYNSTKYADVVVSTTVVATKGDGTLYTDIEDFTKAVNVATVFNAAAQTLVADNPSIVSQVNDHEVIGGSHYTHLTVASNAHTVKADGTNETDSKQSTIAVLANAVYNAGMEAGGGNVSVSSFSIDTERSTTYNTNKTLTVPIKAALTNGTESEGTVTANAFEAWQAGKTDGANTLVADNPSIVSQVNDHEEIGGSHYTHLTVSSNAHTVDGDNVTVSQATSATLAVMANAVYNDGVNSVNISSTDLNGTPVFQSAYSRYAVPIIATASNTHYSTNTVYVNASDAINSVTISNIAGTWNNKTLTVTATASNGKTGSNTFTYSGGSDVSSVTISPTYMGDSGSYAHQYRIYAYAKDANGTTIKSGGPEYTGTYAYDQGRTAGYSEGMAYGDSVGYERGVKAVSVSATSIGSLSYNRNNKIISVPLVVGLNSGYNTYSTTLSISAGDAYNDGKNSVDVVYSGGDYDIWVSFSRDEEYNIYGYRVYTNLTNGIQRSTKFIYWSP